MQRIVKPMLGGLLIAIAASTADAQRANNKNQIVAPSNLSFSYTPTTLTITWPAIDGALYYSALRRSGTAIEQLGNSPTNAFLTPLPTRGAAYEYQITAVGRISSEPSAWVPYTVPTEITAVLVNPVTTATGMTTPAGPAQLTAVSTVPGQIRLWWSEVPNATHYRVLRSNSGGEKDRLITTTGSDAYGNVIHEIPDGPIDFRWTYTYQIYALVNTGSTEIVSASSPSASAKSVPFVQVSGLTYTFTPSTKTPGRLDVKISWNAVKDVMRYLVTDDTWATQKEFFPEVTSYMQPGVPPGYTFRVCVAAIYPFYVRQDATTPCIDIKT
jgi:hypothetical protein